MFLLQKPQNVNKLNKPDVATEVSFIKATFFWEKFPMAMYRHIFFTRRDNCNIKQVLRLSWVVDFNNALKRNVLIKNRFVCFKFFVQKALTLCLCLFSSTRLHI